MSTDVVPFTADALEQYTDPGQFVELALDRAKTWLIQALEHGDIEGIVELKSQAEAIRTYTVQKQLGKDTVLSATEIIRRAERGIAIAVKHGQAVGVIIKSGDIGGGHQSGPIGAVAPGEFFGTNSNLQADANIMATDQEAFESAIAEGRAEGSLSRANVVRKMKGESFVPRSRIQDRDPIHKNAPRMNSNRIIRETVYALEGLAGTLKYVNVDELDTNELDGWITSIRTSLKLLNQTMKEMTRAQT